MACSTAKRWALSSFLPDLDYDEVSLFLGGLLDVVVLFDVQRGGLRSLGYLLGD